MKKTPMKKTPMKKQDIAAKLQQMVHLHNGSYTGPNPARYIPGHELLELARDLEVEYEATIWRRLTKSAQSFWATMASPFVAVYRYFVPLPFERVQQPPVGYQTWADVPKRLRMANLSQGNANPVKDADRATYGSNVLVSIKGDRQVTFLGDESAIPMVTPEQFGLTARQAQAVRAGKGMEWGYDSVRALRAARAANVQLSTLVGVIRQNPPKSEEEAQTLLKLLEGSMGKSAETFMAEVAAAKAKADEAQEDGINEAARDALQAIIENPNADGPLSVSVSTTPGGERVLQDLQTMAASLKQGGV